MARPCAASTTPPRSAHEREEASSSELLDLREQLGLHARERGRRPAKGARVGCGAPPPLAYPNKVPVLTPRINCRLRNKNTGSKYPTVTIDESTTRRNVSIVTIESYTTNKTAM